MKQIEKKGLTAGVLAVFLILACTVQASVTVSPSSAQVNPGGQIQFSATGSTDGVVIWGVSGAGCVGISCGAISWDGLYAAPATAPSPATVTVTATSLSDLSQVGTATVTIGAQGVGISVSPTSATVPVKGQEHFTATVTGTSNTAVNWSVSGVGCVGGSCGTITSSGIYTAPATVPSPATATVTATSIADTSKSASATVVIVSATPVSVTVSPVTAQVAIGAQQQFSATVTGSTNTAVNWSLSGCSGAGCGSISAGGLYTAPATVPSPATLKVVATSRADSSASGSATVTIENGQQLTIAPALPQVKPQGQIQFSASGPGSGIVVWSVTGNGCTGIACGSISSMGSYTAPASAPSPNTVTVTALSLQNPSVTGSTTVTIVSNKVSISVSPSSPGVNVGMQQQFTATVSGTTNTAVTWSITGYDCAGTTCGTISANGLYTAPSAAPNPPFATITATSVADSSASASTTVNIVQQVGITIKPTSAQVAEGQTLQFTAAVTGSSNTGVNWSVSGTGCSGSGCGTVSSTGLYAAPESIPTQILVTATSAADHSVSASATVTVTSPVSVTISPTTAIVAVGAQQSFAVNVSGTTNKAVTWSVSGSGCSGSSCGTVSSAGVYAAPASLPSPATVIVKATSQAMASASATATVSLVASNNSKLNGQYAFSFTGYDSNGAYLAAGSITADGNGNITSGEEDVDNIQGAATSVSLTGTYQVNSDSRGTMSLHSAMGNFTYKFALNGHGDTGRFVSFDETGVRGSGVLKLQDPSAFNPYIFSNGYVLALTGADAFGGRVGALGLIFPIGPDFIAGSTMDVNDGGMVSPTYASFSGVYSVDSTGRGEATLLIPGLGSGILNFAFYVVSANEFLLVSTDPVWANSMILGGPAEVQNGAPFLAASFDGDSVFSLTGNNGSAPQITVGRFGFGGAGNLTVNYDQNDGGKITVAGSMKGAYSMELNGRGTLNLNTSMGSLVWYIYATGPNEGFVMDASTGAAGVGPMLRQAIVPPFSNSDILGSYLMGPGDPVVQDTSLASGVASFDGGSSLGGRGALSGAEDLSKSSALSANLVLAGTYSVSGVSNNGRGDILLTSPTGATVAVWVASGSRFIGLDLDSTTTEPVVLNFEQ